MLDTNIFVFLANEKDRLSHPVRNILFDPQNAICMSVESVREIIIKHRKGDLLNKRWRDSRDIIKAITKEFGIDILPTDLNVMRTLAGLQINQAQSHEDPFDHLIISQAITCRLPLISSDEKFPFYRSQGLELIEN